jgi:hypothetical protein
MKTLADMKRDLVVGKKVKLVWRNGKELSEERTVFKVQTNSICFEREGGGKTWLDMPKATLLEYDGNTIKIYRPITRELTAEEQKIKDNEPRDIEQERLDAISDGSQMFYRRKRYYKEAGYFYLFGTEKEQGKRLTHTERKPMIEDDTIKGELDLVYEVV